jgi:transcriptional regulator with XRE-family HTH domain
MLSDPETADMGRASRSRSDDEHDDDKPTMDPFGSHVRQLRRSRGMTQEVLAEACGLSADTIRRLEHGEFSPSLHTLTKLCGGLNISRATLFVSFEEMDGSRAREIADCLSSRSAADCELGFRVLRSLFEHLDRERGRDR